MIQDAKTAFRVGFLARCAEEGLVGEELTARVKLAFEKRADVATTLANMVTGPVSWILPKAPYLGLAGAAAVGGTAGYGLAKMHEMPIEADEFKRLELADAYRMAAKQIKMNRMLRKQRERRELSNAGRYPML